jgi:hypothetical protein
LTADVLQFLAWFEPNGSPRRDPNLFAGPGIPANPALSGLHLKYAKAAQFNALTAHHGGTHRVEDSIDGHLSLHLGDVGQAGYLVDDVNLDHDLAGEHSL